MPRSVPTDPRVRVVKNADGTYSSERTIGVSTGALNKGRETVIPTLIGGKQLSAEEAIRVAIKSGLKYPGFDSVKKAKEYAARRTKAGGSTTQGFLGIPKMAARKETPSRDAMLKKRVASLKRELAALNKSGKSGSKTFSNKMARLKKYETALRPKKKYKPVDYSKGRKASKASLGGKAVAELVKRRRGPLGEVLKAAEAGGARAKVKAQEGAKGSASGASRSAYEKLIRKPKPKE